jgi:translocation and assembly module TamB
MAKALRITAWTVAGALLLVVLLIAAVLVIGNTAGGRALIERETASLTSGRVRIQGFGGTFPGAIDLAKVELSDARGVWMTAERISLRWSPLALIGWELHVESLEARRIDVARRPVSAPSQAKTSSGHTSLPTIEIDRLAIDTLDLEPAAAGMQAVLNVQGNAYYKSIEDARARIVARRTDGRGDYEVQARLDRARMDASLKLDEPAGGPLEHLAGVPGLGALSVDASLAGPRNAERIQLSARAGALSADAHGTVDLRGRSADLAYVVEAPAMTPAPNLSWKRISLRGDWRGPLAAPRATGILDLEALELPDGAHLGKLLANLEADGHALSVRATADDILLPPQQPQLLAGSPLNVEATMRLDASARPLQLTMTHRLFELKAHADTAGERRATFDLHLPDLAPIATLYKQELAGALTLAGNVTQSGSTISIDVNGNGDLRGASLPAGLLGSNARLRLAASLTDRAAKVQTLQLSGRAISLTAAASADRASPGSSGPAVRAVHATWRVALSDLSLISPTVGGSLESSGKADGPLQSLAASVQASTRLSVRGSTPGTIEATLKAKGLPSTPSGSVEARGTFDGAPLRLDASLERVRGNLFHVVVDRTEWKSLFMNGDLTAGTDIAASRGHLDVRIARLSDLQRLVGTELDGSVTASAAIVPSGGRTRARIELAAHDIAAGGVMGSAQASADGPLDALRIQVSAQSADLGGSPASLSTAARLNGTARVVELDSLEAKYHGETLRLLSPSRVMYANGLRVRNLRLGAKQAVVAVDGELSPALDLRASVHRVDAALVDAFVPHLLAQGTFDADAQVRGSTSAPVGHASLQIANLKLANDAAQGLPAVNARASARFRGSTADLSARLDAGSASHLRASGRAPMNAAGAVDLKLDGSIDAGLVNSFLEARGERAAGTITVAATVTGTAQAPQIGGAVTLSNGDLRDYAQGIHLTAINARLVGGQGVLRIASMKARAGPGELSVGGTVGILQPQMPISMTLTAKRIQPITNDILTANLDADLRVEGTLRKRIDTSGTIHINRAAINVPNGFPPSVAVLNVVQPGEKPQAAPAAQSQLVIGLDLTLQAPEAIFVQGRGLDAQLGGTLRVTGTSADPQVSGGFSMIRGSFSLAGTQLNFTSGRVSFNGEGLKGRIDPTLDFEAKASVTYTAATTVTLRVTGFADAPKLSLSSVPPLPQDDLLGLLLFGKPASQLSAIQLAEVGGGLASLAGGGGGGGGGGTLSKLNPLNWIKKTLGLNNFSVGGAAPSGGATSGGNQISGASVTAGKYISNKVYVAATQSTTGSSQVQVDVDLSRHLKLQTRLGNGTATAQGTTPQNDPGSSIGITYQFEYD